MYLISYSDSSIVSLFLTLSLSLSFSPSMASSRSFLLSPSLLFMSVCLSFLLSPSLFFSLSLPLFSSLSAHIIYLTLSFLPFTWCNTLTTASWAFFVDSHKASICFVVKALLWPKNTKIIALFDTRSWWIDSPTISSNTRWLKIQTAIKCIKWIK